MVGSIQIRTYDAQDGTKRTVADVEADDVDSCRQGSPGRTAPAGRSRAARALGFAPAETDSPKLMRTSFHSKEANR